MERSFCYYTIVQEVSKHGNIAYFGSDDSSCEGGGDTTITGQFYEVIDLSTGSTARCGSGGDSPTPSAPMCVDLQLQPGCYAVYVDGVFRGNVCC